jgi:hypothetical protein
MPVIGVSALQQFALAACRGGRKAVAAEIAFVLPFIFYRLPRRFLDGLFFSLLNATLPDS